MKKLMLVFSLSMLAVNFAFSAELPACKDRNGNELTGSFAEVVKIMNSRANRPQILVKGVVEKLLPEDRGSTPHQKYMITVSDRQVSDLKFQIVSNLEFGRVPAVVGSEVLVCGEYLRVGSGMVHWTHFDPHGGHPDGFTILKGRLYGDVELSR